MKLYKKTVIFFSLLFSSVCFADGIKFSETMSGYGNIDGIYRNVDFNLDVRVDDLDEWKDNPAYKAPMTGLLVVDDIPSHSMTGYMQIFSEGNVDSCESSNDCYHLVYWLKINDGAAVPNYFVGFKTVRNDNGVDILEDMTTLRGCFTQSPYQPLENYVTPECDSRLVFAWWDFDNLWNFTTSFDVINTPWWREWLVPGKFLRIVFASLADEYFYWVF